MKHKLNFRARSQSQNKHQNSARTLKRKIKSNKQLTVGRAIVYKF